MINGLKGGRSYGSGSPAEWLMAALLAALIVWGGQQYALGATHARQELNTVQSHPLAPIEAEKPLQRAQQGSGLSVAWLTGADFPPCRPLVVGSPVQTGWCGYVDGEGTVRLRFMPDGEATHE